MSIDDGRKHLEFWCRYYHPYQFYYPEKKYIKGEKPCIHCVVAQDGFLYRAPFACRKIGSSTPLTRCCLHRGNVWDVSPSEMSRKNAMMYKDLFGWLNGGESETPRKRKKKVTEASTERTDIHGTESGTLTRVFYENSESAEIRELEEEIGSPEVEPECAGASGSDGGLSGMSGETNMQPAIICLPLPLDGSPMQPVRSESTLQDHNGDSLDIVPDLLVAEVRKKPSECVRAVYEPSMREEYDPSYAETTLHACITCMCGKKVWYGYGVQHYSRPKYCKSCEDEQRRIITERYGDRHDLQAILDFELRRVINKA